MGIQISNPPTVPGIVYDRVFLTSLDIRQEHQDDDTLRPVFRVVVRYRLYGVDSDNVRHYSGLGIQTIRFENFLEMAHMALMEENDPSCLETFGVLQERIASLIAKHRGAACTII